MRTASRPSWGVRESLLLHAQVPRTGCELSNVGLAFVCNEVCRPDSTLPEEDHLCLLHLFPKRGLSDDAALGGPISEVAHQHPDQPREDPEGWGVAHRALPHHRGNVSRIPPRSVGTCNLQKLWEGVYCLGCSQSIQGQASRTNERVVDRNLSVELLDVADLEFRCLPDKCDQLIGLPPFAHGLCEQDEWRDRLALTPRPHD